LNLDGGQSDLCYFRCPITGAKVADQFRGTWAFFWAVGIKRLNNAISAQIKRLKAKDSDHKVLSITVPESVALKFGEMCRQKNMTMSEMIEKLTEGGVTKGFNFK